MQSQKHQKSHLTPSPSRMSRGDVSDEESRTVALGRKRARANVVVHHTPKKRTKYRHRVGYQDLRDFVPRGGHFGQSPLADPQLQSSLLDGLDQRSEASSSSSDYQIAQTSLTEPAMNWNNNSSQSSIRTSLRGGGGFGQNRLASGFRAQSQRATDGQIVPHDVVEISDDPGAEDESDEGGIMLNVDAARSFNLSLEKAALADPSDAEDGEIADGSSHQESFGAKAKAEKQRPMSKPHQNTTLPTSSPNIPNLSSPMFRIDARRGARTLADLNPEDLEKQIKYTLFHLPRNQIDLSRPVICLTCLNEGHADQYCPGVMCLSCGGHTKHPSRLCPKQSRCSKCGQRGHDIDTCRSKLRNPELDPCEFCGGSDHVEASCTQRFFPARIERPGGELQLWISCAQCGSKEHLAGDCPEYGSLPAPAWSLRAYSRDKIINLSLQTGAQAREKEAQNRGIRPEGIQIKGRGAPGNRYPRRGESPQFDGDDDFTTRITSNRTRQPSPRNHIHFDDDDDDRRRTGRDHGDDHYRLRSNRPGPSNDYDSYHPAPSSGYRDRSGYGGRNGDQGGRGYQIRRPRSRSPPRHGGPYEGDTWRPPLPRGPPPPHASLPARPAPPRNQQQPQNSSQQLSKKGKRGGGKRKGGGGAAAVVKSMPSSAKNAWNKRRL